MTDKKPSTKTSFKSGHVPGNAVLTARNAVDIRRRRSRGATCRELAEFYGVTIQHISDIARGKRWKNAEQQLEDDEDDWEL